MPELPEVETIRRRLAPRLTGITVVDAGSHGSTKFTPALDVLGAQFGEIRRRGKYLLVDLHGADDAPARELILHLGMTGRLSFADRPDLDHPHLRAWWRVDGGWTLTFHDARRFGRIHVVAAGDHSSIPTLSRLGPEPFDDAFTAQSLHDAVTGSRRRLKTQLLSQRPVAGVGNIYADEALWLARINPAARRLSRPRAARLVDAIRIALTSGLDHGGTTLRDYVDPTGRTGDNQHLLHCYGRWGEPCERCGTELRRRELDARTTTYCPRCQAR